MATQSSNVLGMLQGIASKEVDDATEALAKAMKLANEAQTKQDMLYEYRLDYVKNLNKILESGMGAEAYQNFQNFFGKLDQAIAGQQEVVEQANLQVKIQKQLWQECQRKKLSYEVLSDRTEKRVLKVEQKKDQKLMDEFAMRMTNLFPSMAVQMVAIGEESGSLDAMLDKVATHFENEVDNAVDGLTSMMEPLIMAILGVLVGGLVIAMYLPIFQMGSVVG